MKNLLRKLHIGGNHEDQLDAERIIEGRSSHEASVGTLIGGHRDSTTGVVTPSSSSGSPTSNEFKPSGLSTFLNAVKDSVGRVGQSPTNSNEKSSNPITNAFGQLRQRLDASKENSGGTGELDSSTIATRRGGLSPPGSFKRGGPSPPGSIHRLANENQKAEPPLDPVQIDEDYQVQMAMALSVAGNYQPTTPARVEKAQIEAAKRISLGLSLAGENSPSDTMSYRYWVYNVVDYEEVIPDGFYDLFGIRSDSRLSERMPILADLQKMPVSETSKIEVVLVNRQLDPDLVSLQEKAAEVAESAKAKDESSLRTYLAQKIAMIVAENMGGPVGSETDMLLRWKISSWDVKNSMQHVVLSLGSLNVGLTRHRALLFKVLADHVHLPCQLVKARHYPGVEEEGAVNIIKVDDNREYIIDLMGAPGALIPSDRTAAKLMESVSDDVSLAEVSPSSARTENCSSLLSSTQSSPSSSIRLETGGKNKEGKRIDNQEVTCGVSEGNVNNVKLEGRHHSEPAELEGLDLKPVLHGGPVRPSHLRSPSWTEGIGLPGGRQRKDVSQLLIGVSKDNPLLAQKLHEVLLESGVISDISPKQLQAEPFEDRKLVDDYKPPEGKKPAVPLYPPKRRSGSVPRPSPGSWKDTHVTNEESMYAKERLQRLDSVEGLGDRRPLEIPPADMQAPPVAPPLPPLMAASLGPMENSGGFVPVAAAAAAAATAAVVASTMVAAAAKVDPGGSPKLEVPIAAAATATAAVVAATSAVVGRRTESSESSPQNSDHQPGGDGGKAHESADSEKGGNAVKQRCSGESSEPEGSTPGSSHGAGSNAYDALDGEVSIDEERSSDNLNRNSRKKYDAIQADVAEWEIPWEDIVIGERIGLGSYGEVYRGDWHGSEVAVKKFLDQDLSGDALEEFRSEVLIMRRLRHPNVVLFMGAITRSPNLSIVTEFLPRGSLYRLIHRPNNQLDERRRLRMALDVAKGMNYLHSGNPIIVHRDLKSPNLLVDKNWVVKVCDFGLSRMKHNTFLSSKSTAGTPEWMAPEMLRNEPSNEKCDVYSFGVILWELATLQQPWGGMNPMQVVGAVGFQHRRLDIPPEMDPGLARIIRECWHDKPSARPSFAQLMAALRPLQRPLSEAQSAEVSRQGQTSQGSTIQSQPVP